MFLADLFTLVMNIGSGFFQLVIDLGKDRAFADLLTITVSLAGYTITYNESLMGLRTCQQQSEQIRPQEASRRSETDHRAF
jgi:hypothetical protein